MCVLAGCDFLPSVPGVGISRAHGFISKYQSVERVSIYLICDSSLKQRKRKTFKCVNIVGFVSSQDKKGQTSSWWLLQLSDGSSFSFSVCSCVSSSRLSQVLLITILLSFSRYSFWLNVCCRYDFHAKKLKHLKPLSQNLLNLPVEELEFLGPYPFFIPTSLNIFITFTWLFYQFYVHLDTLHLTEISHHLLLLQLLKGMLIP